LKVVLNRSIILIYLYEIVMAATSLYVPKKSKTLEIEDIQKFISEALNETYLMMKVSIFILLHGPYFKNFVLGSINNRHVCRMSQT
jgi:hypothetical protein